MRAIMTLVGRNLRVFLRDKTSVFFSLLAVFIIIGLYALFLGDVTLRSIESEMPQGTEGIRWMVDSWIMAGILAVNAVTVTLGMFGVMIEDEEKKRLGGFLVAPIRRSQLTAGYLGASWVAGFLLCVLTLVLAEIYIVSSGGELLPLDTMLKVLGLTALQVFSASTMVFFLVSFIRSSSGFATLSTVLGTVIGFLTGIYIPIGSLPKAVQSVVKLIPSSHAAALMRQMFMEEPMNKVFGGSAPEELRSGFMQSFGAELTMGDQVISVPVMLLVIGGSGLLFMLLSVWRMNRRRLH